MANVVKAAEEGKGAGKAPVEIVLPKPLEEPQACPVSQAGEEGLKDLLKTEGIRLNQADIAAARIALEYGAKPEQMRQCIYKVKELQRHGFVVNRETLSMDWKVVDEAGKALKSLASFDARMGWLFKAKPGEYRGELALGLLGALCVLSPGRTAEMLECAAADKQTGRNVVEFFKGAEGEAVALAIGKNNPSIARILAGSPVKQNGSVEGARPRLTGKYEAEARLRKFGFEVNERTLALSRVEALGWRCFFKKGRRTAKLPVIFPLVSKACTTEFGVKDAEKKAAFDDLETCVWLKGGAVADAFISMQKSELLADTIDRFCATERGKKILGLAGLELNRCGKLEKKTSGVPAQGEAQGDEED